MLSKILVPLDGSELAESALPTAAALAAAAGGEVCLLHAAVGYHIYPTPAQAERLGTAESLDGLGYITRMANYLEWLIKGLQASTAVVSGQPARAIAENASTADLIVMTTHGRSGFTRWVLGSVAESVVRLAPCPVLVLPGNLPIQHIAIGLDGTDWSEEAVGPALTIAVALEARVTLLHVQPDLSPVGMANLRAIDALDRGMEARILAQFEAETLAYLQAAAAKYQRDLPSLTTAMMHGDVAESILEFIGKERVDMFALAPHGRGVWERWRHGSISHALFQNAPCALLMVPHLNGAAVD